MESRYGPPSRTIGLVPIRDSFDCVECGRWLEVLPTAETYARLVETTLGFNPEDWGRVRAAAQPSSPLRPAFLQREFDKGYDEAVAIIDAAVQLGVLEVAKRGVVAAHPDSSNATSVGRSIATKPDHNQDPRPDPPAAALPRSAARRLPLPVLRPLCSRRRNASPRPRRPCRRWWRNNRGQPHHRVRDLQSGQVGGRRGVVVSPTSVKSRNPPLSQPPGIE